MSCLRLEADWPLLEEGCEAKTTSKTLVEHKEWTCKTKERKGEQE
jgi:hypothetical protein